MIDGVRLKVCGLTSLVDAEGADRSGADYLGFILYPKSPRHIALAQYAALAPRLPDRRRVAVTVEPTSAPVRHEEFLRVARPMKSKAPSNAERAYQQQQQQQ